MKLRDAKTLVPLGIVFVFVVVYPQGTVEDAVCIIGLRAVKFVSRRMCVLRNPILPSTDPSF